MTRIYHLIALFLFCSFAAGGCSSSSAPPPNTAVKSASPGVGDLDGNLEGVDNVHIVGWACDSKRSDDALTISILDGNQEIASIKAGDFRKDLRDANIGDGKHGFVVPTPASLKDGQPHEVHAVVAGANFELQDSPKQYQLAVASRAAIAPAPNANGYAGTLEAVNDARIIGWVWKSSEPNQAITVTILDGTNKIASVNADVFRKDLLAADVGNGKHSFVVAVPTVLKDGKPHKIRAVVANANFELNGSPKQYRATRE